jgi:hypothetical protein
MRLAPLLLAFALAAGGCGGDSGGGTPTATGTPEVAPTATAIATPTGPSPTPAPDIVDFDFEHYAPLNEFLASAGDVYVRQIRYEELTKDDRREAMVYITSDGEGGDIVVFIYSYGAGGLVQLKRLEAEQGTIVVDVFNLQLATQVGVYQPGDPLCCPSQIKTSLYDWNGSDFVPSFENTQ